MGETSSMQFTDKVTLGDTRLTRDGYLVAEVRCARTGIQVYSGREMGKPEQEKVRVYRPEAEVFASDAMASFAYRPMTNDHPADMVTADNWKEHAVGLTGGEVARDGEFIRVPLTLMDRAAIDDVKAGKKQLSAGYTCDVEWTPGTTPSGEPYDAVQKNIRGNHLAVVAAARGGPSLRIGDDEGTRPMTLKNVTVDGISIEVTDQGAQVIAKMQTQISDAAKAIDSANAAHATVVAAKDKELGTKDAEIEKLKNDQLTTDKLDDLVAARADVQARAKVVADGIDTKGKNIQEIRRLAVAKKLGDEKVKDKSDDYVEALFDSLAADNATTDTVRAAVLGGTVRATDGVTAESAAYRDSVADLNAWRNPKVA